MLLLPFHIIQQVQFLLNDEEERIVRELHLELFNREKFRTKEVYYNPQHPCMMTILNQLCVLQYSTVGKDQRVNCSINRLAELNIHSCTDVVRAAATFFLEKDTFQDYCNHKG